MLDSLSLGAFAEDELEGIVAEVEQAARPGEAQSEGHIYVGGTKGGRQQVPLKDLKYALLNPSERSNHFCSWFLRYSALMLDGKSRITLVGKQPGGNLQHPPQNSFQSLFKDDTKRLEVRRIVHDAFGLHFVVDPTELGQLQIRLAKRAPNNDLEERGIHEEAVEYHSAALPIDAASDGVKAFTGIVTEVIAGDPRVVIIDEPEAFLHPALSQKLGLELSKAASDSGKNVFVSTHSASFVMGCIQSGAPVDIVRLTYRNGIATSRLLPSSKLLELMRNPLLRSTGVLNGLFYEHVVVTEADADRAFYQEVNERLLASSDDRGISNCLFINAQNKQTIPTILQPLRELGIPAVGIVDVDIVKEGGKVWESQMSGMGVPDANKPALQILRKTVKDAMDATGKDMKRDGGVDILGKGEEETANNLFDQMASYGLFVVRKGELEAWLSQLGASGHGPSWLIEVFDKMGSDSTKPNYLKPSVDDVWAFVDEIKQWLVDPNRKGIPG